MINVRHTLEGDVCVLRVFEDETEVIIEDDVVGSLGTSERGRECDRSRRFRCFEGDGLVLFGLLVFEAIKKASLLGYAARNGLELRISMFGL